MLARVLNSTTFERSEQLRNLLRFLFDSEVSGRACVLTEYQVGVEALGRPSDFSPTEDSVVRNRTHALRRKLQETYEHELSGETLRIQLPKGSYVLQFAETEPAPPAVEQLSVAVPAPIVPGGGGRKWLRPLIGGTVLLLAAAVAGFYIGSHRNGPAMDPAVAEFWDPVLQGNARISLCLAAPPHLLFREQPMPRAQFRPTEQERAWYEEQVGHKSGAELFLLPVPHAPLHGDSLAAVTIARFLGASGVEVELVPESVIRPPGLRDRAVIIFGRPEYSEYARVMMSTAPLAVDFGSDTGDYIIYHRNNPKRRFVTDHSTANIQYALITVVNSDPGAGSHRTVLFAGTHSTATLAAAEFFTSADCLRELRRRLPEPLPRQYQVVIRARIIGAEYLPSNYQYVAHEVW